MNAKQMKAYVASYWRFKRQCPMVALEANNSLSPYNDGGTADVLVVTKKRELIEVEIKTTISDLRRDWKKRKHYRLQDILSDCPLHYFYFAVPIDIADKAKEICADIYPYAGLLSVGGRRIEDGIVSGVYVLKVAQRIDRPKLTLLQLARMAREMSATICRLSDEVLVGGKNGE